jgi:hypothetical protein
MPRGKRPPNVFDAMSPCSSERRRRKRDTTKENEREDNDKKRRERETNEKRMGINIVATRPDLISY